MRTSLEHNSWVDTKTTRTGQIESTICIGARHRIVVQRMLSNDPNIITAHKKAVAACLEYQSFLFSGARAN